MYCVQDCFHNGPRSLHNLTGRGREGISAVSKQISGGGKFVQQTVRCGHDDAALPLPQTVYRSLVAAELVAHSAPLRSSIHPTPKISAPDLAG